MLSFILVSSMVTANLFQKTYNYVVHGHFCQVPMVGLELLVTQLYISSPSDITLFKEQGEIGFFSKVYDSMKEQELLKKDSNPGSHYEVAYNYIIRIIQRVYIENYVKKDIVEEWGGHSEEWPKFDNFTTKIALTLMKKNYKGTIKQFIHNIYRRIGGFYYFVLILFSVGISFYLYNTTKDMTALVFLFMVALNGLNYSLVSVFEPVLIRYSFYTDTVQLVAFMLLIVSLISRLGNISQSKSLAYTTAMES
jgi:hypothetical protein